MCTIGEVHVRALFLVHERLDRKESVCMHEMGDDPNADLIKMTPEERRAAGRAAVLRLFDCL